MPDSTVTNPSAPDPAEGLAQRILEQVEHLTRRLDKAERRVRLERALADAQAQDVQAAADELDAHAADPAADLPALIRRLKRDRPALFTPTHRTASPANLPDSPRDDPTLAILRERAQRGDRASLLLYLQARRSRT